MKKIKKKDIVLVISGKDKGKKGEVLKVLKDNKIIVSKVNVVKKKICVLLKHNQGELKK